MRNIIYIRTSTDEQNPKNQLSDINTIAPNDCVIYEEKQSAWKDHLNNRPIFKQIYDLVKENQVKSLNVWDLDRLFRNRVQCVEFMKLCQYKKVVIRSYRQKWLTEFEKIPSPWNDIMSDLMIQIISWLAEEESNKKSERVKSAYQNFKGNNWGRPALPLEIEKIRDLRNKGLSIRRIAQDLKIKKNQVEKGLKLSEKMVG